MSRIDLPEIEDHPGLPAWLRDAMTGYLRAAIEAGNPYAAVTPVLVDLLRSAASPRVLDLASGGGGPWPAFVRRLSEAGIAAQVTLSDAQPNREAARVLERTAGISYLRKPLSALEVPPLREGVRTMFTALHHFDRAHVQAILRSAQDARVPFLAAEATHRSVRGVLATAFIPLLVLLLMPRVRPRRALPLLLTYLPPVLPLLIWWDGFASTLRTYRAAELKEIVGRIAEPGYRWTVEEIDGPRVPIPVTVVVGRPAGGLA